MRPWNGRICKNKYKAGTMSDFNERLLSRRGFLTVAGLGAMAAGSGCASASRATISTLTAFSGGGSYGSSRYREMYGRMVDNGEVIPAVNLSQGGLRPRWRISKKDLTAFLAARSNQVPEVKPGPRANAIPKPSIPRNTETEFSER